MRDGTEIGAVRCKDAVSTAATVLIKITSTCMRSARDLRRCVLSTKSRCRDHSDSIDSILCLEEFLRWLHPWWCPQISIGARATHGGPPGQLQRFSQDGRRARADGERSGGFPSPSASHVNEGCPKAHRARLHHAADCNSLDHL